MSTAHERFWSKVDRRGPDECWPWMAGVGSHGYGAFHPDHGVTVLAHRFAVDAQPGCVIDHTCHNGASCPPGPCPHRLCCNPALLEPVSNTENVNRSHNSNVSKTHCPRGHLYTVENTRTQVRARTKSRSCKTCAREADRSPNRRRPAIVR